MNVCAIILLLVALGLPGRLVAGDMVEATSSLFSGSGNCAFCHDQWGRGLTDRSGRDVSIGGDWRATMMAHSFRDPLWRAAMEWEVEQRPKDRRLIEDKCQACHAPMARTQALKDGTRTLTHASARRMPLASDGVSCTLCHQIQPENLGQVAGFSGRFEIGSKREIFGPYDDVFTGPMLHHVNYLPRWGRHVQDSGLCATCHTLFTTAVDAKGGKVGEFPEQAPYLEWRNSVYPERGRHCQDCHMPRLDEPVSISSRPPWLSPRQPFWRHQFAGGNAFMLEMLRDHATPLGANADPAHFDRMIAHTRRQLAQAATVSVTGRRDGSILNLAVVVENRAGHKFPTGHPYRRAWVEVHVRDGTGRTLFLSGAADSDGRIAGRPAVDLAHHDVITDSSQAVVYEAVMGDANGRPTRSLLRAVRYLKDSRLPPRGFRPDGPAHEHTATCGEPTQDSNFNRGGSGRDEITYRADVGAISGPLSAEVRILYQSVPPEAVDHLLAGHGTSAKEFAALYRKAKKNPETVHQTQIVLE